MIRLLDYLKDDVDFGNFQIEDVRTLQSYDKENQTELCATLLCYLENSKSTSRTASEMHIYRNSVYYRINKCMDLLPDIDFENGTMSFLVMLSLYIAQYDFYRSHRKDCLFRAAAFDAAAFYHAQWKQTADGAPFRLRSKEDVKSCERE